MRCMCVNKECKIEIGNTKTNDTNKLSFYYIRDIDIYEYCYLLGIVLVSHLSDVSNGKSGSGAGGMTMFFLFFTLCVCLWGYVHVNTPSIDDRRGR